MGADEGEGGEGGVKVFDVPKTRVMRIAEV